MVSVTDDIPYIHPELIYYSEDKKGMTFQMLVRLVNGEYLITNMMQHNSKKWEWDAPKEVTHWMPLHEIP